MMLPHRAAVGACRCGWLLLLAGLLTAEGGAGEAYYRFETSGSDFLGPRGLSTSADTLRVGVIGPHTGAAAEQLRGAVELAAIEANERPGVPPVAFLYHGDDGPWSSAAATAVRLIREAGVVALIAGPDGARAHACELVAAKLWVPVLAPTAADHTVDYANVPWAFRSGPDDRAQLEALLAAAAARDWRRLAWLGGSHRDDAVALATARRLVGDPARRLELVVTQDSAALAAADAVVVWGGVDEAVTLLRRLRRAAPSVPALGPWTLTMPAARAANADGPLLASVPASGPRPPETFARRWRTLHRSEPTWLAALTYDAAALLAATIQDTGGEPVALRQALAAVTYDGVAGRFAFDALGGRLGGGVAAVWVP